MGVVGVQLAGVGAEGGRSDSHRDTLGDGRRKANPRIQARVSRKVMY